MATGDRRRALLWALAVATLVGLAFGWLARAWRERSSESRARDTFERMRERAREITR